MTTQASKDGLEADLPQSERKETATLGGGCFWCVEPAFDELSGVEQVVTGYAGGNVPNPSYQQVCSETTGHAEVIQITFDPKAISFKELLEVFFVVHDPTTLNRQGDHLGSRYRSLILYHNEQQRDIAEQMIQELTAAKIWDAPIVTEIKPYSESYPAEDGHQKYFKRHPEESYCQLVIAPKVAKVRQQFLAKLRQPAPSH